MERKIVQKTREAFISGGVSKDWRVALQETVDIVLEEAAKIADEFDVGRRVYDARGNLQDSSAGGKIAKRIRTLKGE